MQMTANFSSEAIAARRSWNVIFNITKGKNPTINMESYKQLIFFKKEGKITASSNEQKLIEFITRKSKRFSSG